MASVLITPRSFGKYSDEAKRMLIENGLTIVMNPVGGIMSKDQMKESIRDVDGVIIGVDPLDASVLEAAPHLQAIAKYGVGLDNVDLEVAEKRGIDVSITRGANSNAVADFAFTLMLAVSRRLTEIDQGCRHGDWTKKVALDVWGKKLGVLGLGAIGRGVAHRAQGFNMEVYGYDLIRDNAMIDSEHITFTDVDTIIQTCDFISIHLPLTPQTKHLINAERINMMKSTAILINTARGGIIDEEALFQALKKKTIYGAGLDVFEHEPAGDSPLLALDNVVAGSHCSASTEGAVNQMSLMAAENLIASLKKKGVI